MTTTPGQTTLDQQIIAMQDQMATAGHSLVTTVLVLVILGLMLAGFTAFNRTTSTTRRRR